MWCRRLRRESPQYVTHWTVNFVLDDGMNLRFNRKDFEGGDLNTGVTSTRETGVTSVNWRILVGSLWPFSRKGTRKTGDSIFRGLLSWNVVNCTEYRKNKTLSCRESFVLSLHPTFTPRGTPVGVGPRCDRMVVTSKSYTSKCFCKRRMVLTKFTLTFQFQ